MAINHQSTTDLSRDRIQDRMSWNRNVDDESPQQQMKMEIMKIENAVHSGLKWDPWLL